MLHLIPSGEGGRWLALGPRAPWGGTLGPSQGPGRALPAPRRGSRLLSSFIRIERPELESRRSRLEGVDAGLSQLVLDGLYPPYDRAGNIVDLYLWLKMRALRTARCSVM
mgnify:CR=1 FL=1